MSMDECKLVIENSSFDILYFFCRSFYHNGHLCWRYRFSDGVYCLRIMNKRRIPAAYFLTATFYYKGCVFEEIFLWNNIFNVSILQQIFDFVSFRNFITASTSSSAAPPPSSMTLRPRPTTRNVPESSSQSSDTTRPMVTFNPVKKVRTVCTVPYSELEASFAAGAKLPSLSSPHIPKSSLTASAKRTAVKQSIVRNRTSSTPSRATKRDRVRASIRKNARVTSWIASSKFSLDPDSSPDSLLTPETNHVTLVDAFISISPSPIIHCIGGDHLLHYSHNDSFPWLNKPWDTSLRHYRFFFRLVQ